MARFGGELVEEVPEAPVRKGGRFGGETVAVSKQETPYMSPAELQGQRKGYRARLAGVGEVTPETKGFEKPALEGGLGRQLAGAAEGFVAGIPGAPGAIGQALNIPGLRALPSGPQIATPIRKLFGKISPAEASGMETGAMFSPLKVPSAIIGTGRAFKTIGSAAKETGEGLFPASAIEKGMAPATSVSAVGEKLEQKIGSKLEQLVQTRRKEFEGVKDAYFEAGRQAELPILNDYTRSIQEFYAKNADKLSVDERALLKKSLDRLAERPVSLTEREAGTVAPGFDAIEKERRFLDDVAKGLKVEGAEAIPAMFARDLSKMLETSIQRHVPKQFEQFNDVYKTLSEPINRYNTALGQAVTKTADEYLPQVAKIDPAKIPDKFFSSRRSINELRAMTGDEKFVQQVAREHVANDLRDIKKAEQIKSYLQKNYDWLQELPELRSDLERIADKVKTGEGIKTLGKYGIAALIGAASANKLNKFLGD